MAAVQHAGDQVLEYPESAPRVRGDVRGKVVAHYPYTLMYRIDDDVIVILAVAHHKQHPELWVERAR